MPPNAEKSNDNCRVCFAEIDDDMVCCDKCNGWHHFTCVGVTESISSKAWVCGSCVAKSNVTTAITQHKQVQQGPVDNLQKLPATAPSGEQVSQNHPMDSAKTKWASTDSIHLSTSSKSKRLSAEMKLLEEEEHLLRQRQALLSKKKELLKQMESDSEDNEEGWAMGSRKTTEDCPTAESTKTPGLNENIGQLSDNNDIAQGKSLVNSVATKVNELKLNNANQSDINTTLQWLPGVLTNVSLQTQQQNRGRADVTRLTKEQIAARNSFAKDLVKFSGNPEDWPLFLSTYEQTTELCGFSENENLLRLRNSLDGDALRSVRSLLYHPSCVPQVIETLRLKFGRPEIILSILLRRVRELPPIKENKLEALVDFSLEVQNIIATMKSANLKNYLDNPEIEHGLVQKLPGMIAAFWGMHKLNLPTSNLENFGSWLFQFAQGANSVLVPDSYPANKATKRGNVNTHMVLNDHDWVSFGYSCVDLASCSAFKGLARAKKWELVRAYGVCRRCLKIHNLYPCKSTKLCGINDCKFAHHPLLHKDSSITCNIVNDAPASMMFRILPVTLHGNGRKISTFAFFDEGSSLTLIEDDLREELGLEGVPSPLCLKWTADTHRYEEDSVTLNLQISGSSSKNLFDLNNVHTVKSLNLPRQSLDVHQLKAKYSYLREIPIATYKDAQPKLLIGLNNGWLGASLKTKERTMADPIAEKTRLGWSVKGPVSVKPNHSLIAFHTCEKSDECDTLLQAVKRYILLDNLDVKALTTEPRAKEDIEALSQLKENTKKLESKYETRLLWKSPRSVHPASFSMAKRRAQCLFLRLSKDPALYTDMDNKIKDYVSKGYAVRLPETTNEMGWYLPIFPVTNPSKPSKLRIVWDAAAKVKGVSLNSMLLKGPDLTAPLVDVLRRFRQKRFAISGDIREMYHQVKIHPADQHYQKFLWYEKGKDEPTQYALTVMTFGATCSPCAAQYIKNLNAESFYSTHPRAVEAIVENHYVDDMLDSMDTEEELLKLAIDVRFIHAQGGFEIRNWRSNSLFTLRALNVSTTEGLNLDVDQNLGQEKVLGMWWLTSEDSFSFKMSPKYDVCELLNGTCRPTKRQVLSIIMSVFGPLGLVNFFVVYAKILQQDIWRSGCAWDEPIYDAEYSRWLRWTQHLADMTRLKIPRHFFNGNDQVSDLELHAFVDASEGGYAAVLYVRYKANQSFACSLIGSKAKVAPLKLMSVPRLELQSALLGTRFALSVKSSLKLNFNRQVFWTDSKTVLSWIRSDHRRYSQFVAFRVSEILETTEANEWKWVPSSENVADEATKWQKTPKFTFNSRWFNGPNFLQLVEDAWPSEMKEQQTIEEIRPQFLGHHGERREKFFIRPERFSTWSRFAGATSTFLQTVRVWKNKGDKHDESFLEKSQTDIASAETMIWKYTQRDAFGDEVATLSRNSSLKTTSSLYKLSAYMDKNGIIRLGSRAQNIDRDDPIILPKDHYVTQLLVMHYHVKYLHANHETVVNEIKQLFWIAKLRSVLKKIRKQCQHCLIRSASPKPPKMANLPSARLASFCRPFTHVGVDYFGPIMVIIRRSSEKRYGVLFTCLSTRAVHLEIANSLSTESCIVAIRSFIARRGTPREWWSDNGTNFRGAEREMTEAFKMMDKNEMVRTFTSSAMSWKFIPPSSPHMGGAWERLVRSVKSTLTSILPTQRLTDELLRGAFAEVENVVNSRPLTYIPLEQEEDEALTPNHFLHGSSNGMKPLTMPEEEGRSLRRGWKVTQHVADLFWKRWLQEYLPNITRRTKWFQPVKPLEIGDIVLIADPNSPRNCWPKGRIVDVKLSSDGQVRSANVKTTAGVYIRPAAKIAVLPVYKQGRSCEGHTGGEC